jgi:hypothetical protein
MQTRRTPTTIALIAMIATSINVSQADELESLAPLLDEHTFAVLRIDLDGIDLTALQKQYFDALSRSNSDRIGVSVAVEQTRAAIDQLRSDGARQAYLVLTAAKLPHLSLQHLDESLATIVPFLAIPGAKAETLQIWRAKFWNENKRESQPDHKPPLKSGEIRGVGVVAFADLFDALTAQKPQPRPDFGKATEAAGNRPLRMAFAPPPIFARAAEEILLAPLPGMEQPLGPIVARGVKWFGFGVEPNLDRFSAHMVIQSSDAASAKALADMLNRATVLAGTKLAESGQFQGAIGTALITNVVPTATGDQLVLALDQQRATALSQFANAAIQLSRANAMRHTSMNNLKHIGLAFHNYYDAKKHLPDRAIRDKEGKPLLSWRVAILPYLEGGKLYKEFHLDEPWDSEHNRKLIEKMPEPFQSSDTAHLHPGRTRYLVPVGEKMAFPPDRGITFKEFTDGTSQTVFVVESDPDHAVIWTKPDDLEIDLDNPKRGLTNGKQPFNCARADGSAHVVPGDIDVEALRRLFTRNGGEVVKE